MTDKINHYVEEKDIVLTMFLELAKAFNSISSDIFNQNFKNSRFLLISFLFNMKYCVKNKVVESHLTIISHGVPQGTGIETLVHLLYVNVLGKK